jgi:mRNA interferase HicA
LVYIEPTKRREVQRRLRELGWRFLRHGGSHDIWTDGSNDTALPRHAEISEGTARSIIRYAERCAALKEED